MTKNSYTKSYIKPAKSFTELNDTLIHSFSGIKSDITNLQEQTSQTQKRFSQIQEQLEGFSTDYVTVDKYNVLKIKIAELQESLKQMWDIDKKLSQIDESSIKNIEFDKHLSSWSNEVEIIKQDISEIGESRVHKDQIRKLTDDINEEFDSLKDLFEDVRASKTSATKFQKQLDGIRVDFDSLDKRNAELKKDKVSQKTIQKLTASINAEFDDVKELVSQIKSDQSKLVTSKEFKTSQAKNSKVQDKLFNSFETLKKNQKTLTTVEETKTLVSDFNKELDELRSRISKTHSDFANKQKVAAAALNAVTKSFLTKKDANKQAEKIGSELEQIQVYVDSQSQSLKKYVTNALTSLKEQEKKAAKRHKDFFSVKKASLLESSINSEIENLHAIIDSENTKQKKELVKSLVKVQNQVDKVSNNSKSHFTQKQAVKLKANLSKEMDSIYAALEEDEKQVKSLLNGVLKKISNQEKKSDKLISNTVNQLKKQEKASAKLSKSFYTKKQAAKLEAQLLKELDSVYALLDSDEKNRTEQLKSALIKVADQEKKAAKRHKNYLTLKQSNKLEEDLSRNISSLREQLNGSQKELDEISSSMVTKKSYVKHTKSVKDDINALKQDIRESRKDFLGDIKDLKSHFTTDLKEHKSYVGKNYLHVNQAESLVEDVNKEFLTVQDQFEGLNKQVVELSKTVKSQAKELKDKDKLKKELDKTKSALESIQGEIHAIKAGFVSNTRFQKTLKYFKKYIKELEKEAVEEERFDKLNKEVNSLKKSGFRKASITKESKKQVKLVSDNSKSKSKSKDKKSKSNPNKKAASEFKKLFQKKVQEKEDALPFSKTYKLANGLIIIAFMLLIISIGVFFMGKIALTDRLAMISVVAFVVGLLLRLFVISKRN